MALLADRVNLIAAVFDCYGVRLPQIPGDGKMYSFPVDQLRIGFVVSFGDVHAFGCQSDGDNYYFDGECWDWFYSKPAAPTKQGFNRMIIECARGLIDRGDVLGPEDSARLKLAVQQVEANS